MHRGDTPADRTFSASTRDVSLYAARRGGPIEAQRRLPGVLHGAWRTPDNVVTIPIASLLDDATTVQLILDAQALAVFSGASLRLISPDGERALGLLQQSMTLPIDLPAQGAVVLMLEPTAR